MRIYHLICVCLLVLHSCLLVKAETPYKLYNLISDYGASCLDGSAPGFYFKNGTVNKFIIYFNGGAWCYSTTDNLTLTLENCYNR